MSIKDLFKSGKSFKVSSIGSSDDAGREVQESSDFVEEYNKQKNRFIPAIDFRNPENFAKYGLAEKYYEDAIKRIYTTYPYDGSRKEKLEWHNSSSYIDDYIFKNEYPRTTGYIVFSADGWGTLSGSVIEGYGSPSSSATPGHEYILIKGGPHANPAGMDTLRTGFTGSNIYDTGSNRQSNLEVNFSGAAGIAAGSGSGITVEFWMKKDGWAPTKTEKEVIFDLWNNEASSSYGYGRFRLELSATLSASTSPFRVSIHSGTYGFENLEIGSGITTSSVADGKWQHYALSLENRPNYVDPGTITTRFYISGVLNEEKHTAIGHAISEPTGAWTAYIGALRLPPSGNVFAPATTVTQRVTGGFGKLSASLDEFRFWKSKRTSKDIGRYWYTQINGGTNTDSSKYNNENPVDLGVYYKFNEGITKTSSIDSTILDYSGRFSNGTWTGYTTNSRNTGSAMFISSASLGEFRDPIIYSDHDDVKVFLESKKVTGSAYDAANNSALYDMLPRWIIDEDTKSAGNLKNLTQIVASYFDTLHLQVEALPHLREATYSTYMSSSTTSGSWDGSLAFTSSAKPLPFANRLLESMGMTTPDLFIDSKILESLSSRDEKRNYEEEIYNVKNLIYHNIYNNLSYIYKSKGTEKSLRNLIRCYGVDDELVKINVYGNEALYKLKDNFRVSSLAKNVIDFDHPSRHAALVYQYPSGSESESYIHSANGKNAQGTIATVPFTVEAEIIFPRKRDPSDVGYYNTNFMTSSLFGCHEARSTSGELAWASGDDSNFQVYAIRTGSIEGDRDTKDAYFMLTSSNPHPFPKLTSSVFPNVYGDSKWNFAVRLKHDKFPFIKSSSFGYSASADAYTVEFYGVNTVQEEIINEFSITGSSSKTLAENFSKALAKRLYIGAHRTNFTGAVLQQTDVKFSSYRHWLAYLDDETIRAHAKDSTNYGLKNPYRNFSLFEDQITGAYIPTIETLGLHWDFRTATGSDASGQFFVNDFSSGSTGLATRYVHVGPAMKTRHPGRADFFPANSTSSVGKYYINTAKQQLPESISSNDMVTIVNEDDVAFTRSSRPVQYFLAVEKSMYQTISEEMINMFATIVDFNNLIGHPVNKYRSEYKDLAKLKELFFEKVRNTPDLDKYVEYYKWIDSAITSMIEQLVPATANMTGDLRTLIESHVLERNKYWTKYPTFDANVPSDALEGPVSLLGGHLTNAWKFNQAPLPSSPLPQYKNCYWWKNRAGRGEASITSGDSNVDRDRDKILSASSPDYGARGITHKFDTIIKNVIHGGTNFYPQKRIRLAHGATTEFGPLTIFKTDLGSVTASNNFLLALADHVNSFNDCADKPVPDESGSLKRKWDFTTFDASDIGQPGSYDYNILKGNISFPFNMYSSSMHVPDSGYFKDIDGNFKKNVDFTNIHVDVYEPDNETPMQGPFAEKHVGGLQHRHIDVNRYDSNKSTVNNIDDGTSRPESWYILMGALDSGDFAVGLVGPDYTSTGEHDKDTPRARLYRDEMAKRSVNIRNIRSTGPTIGNYSSSFEYVNTVGRTQNNAFFKENNGVLLPSRYNNTSSGLPKTTNIHTLIGVNPSTYGNHFGPPLASLDNYSNRFYTDTTSSLPRRDLTGSDSVIVNRFSAPGGPEVNSRGYLDVAAEEYSVYNALPYRNLSVRGTGSGESSSIRAEILQGASREGLQALLTRHQGQFGIDSQLGSVQATSYSTVASFHKVHKNVRRRVVLSSDDLITTATASVYNNAWYAAPIPQSEIQYYWITSSLQESATTNPNILGYVTGSSVIEFVPSSSVSAGGISVDFVGLNTLVADPVKSGVNSLSASDGKYKHTMLYSIATHEVLNSLLLHRNGPYRHPSWKQIRTGDHQVARHQKGYNIISITQQPEIIRNFSGLSGSQNIYDTVKAEKSGSMKQFTEALITSKFKPMVHILESKNYSNLNFDETDSKVPQVNLGFKHSYGNNISMFSNRELDYTLDLENNSRQVYDNITDLYIDSTLQEENNPIERFKSLSYRETVYPKAVNTYLNKVRNRQTFSSSFWRGARADRDRSNFVSSQKFSITNQSIWSLDARNNFSSSTTIGGETDGAGELQNGYTIFHEGDSCTGSTNVISLGNNKSVRFDGRDNYLHATAKYSTSSLNRDKDDNTTISMWFKCPSQNSTSASLIMKGHSGVEPAYHLRFDKDNVLYANVGGSVKLTKTGLANNQWHHVALAWSGSGNMYLYVNGVAEGNTGVGGTGATAEDLVTIGAKANGTSAANSGFWRGNIDEVSFWSVALSEGEVEEIYNDGCPTKLSSHSKQSSMLAWWRMGDNSNDDDQDTIYDEVTTGSQADTNALSASGFPTTNTYGILIDTPICANVDNICAFGPLYSRRFPEMDDNGVELGYFAGDTLWEAGVQAGKDPFYNSYDEYREEMRGIGKDYSIIPEFRITKELSYYVKKKNNFLADNIGFLNLTGAVSQITSSTNSDFFKTYTNSDFLKYFDVIKKQHENVGTPTGLALRCNALLKFLPYASFYPAERTVALAKLFSASYAEKINSVSERYSGYQSPFGNQATFKTFMTPFFAPGILYNTIKSGLAVDYPIMTGSWNATGSGYNFATMTSGSIRISSSFHYRVPFEALVEPEIIATLPIVDSEPHDSALINSTASWDGAAIDPLYKLSMHNFLAEVPNFFLKDKISTIVSAPEDDKKYFKAEQGREYRMRVVLRNGDLSRKEFLVSNIPTDNSTGFLLSQTGSKFTKPNITMYSRRSAFGPPVDAKYVKFNHSFESHTPPYMDGYAEVEYLFKPVETKRHTVDEIIGGLTASYFRVGEQYFDGYSAASGSRMQISASVNLTDVVQLKKVTYDLDGRPTSIESDSTAPNVWVISPKFETPILDFKDVSVTYPASGSRNVAKGMWHQYGSLPTGSNGVFLEVQDIPRNEWSSNSITASLADLVGFNKKPTKLGIPAEERVIKEAVVAVPFVESKQGIKEFFSISKDTLSLAKSMAAGQEIASSSPDDLPGKSIVNMVKAMQDYVFPPMMDFVTNDSVEPFAMYIFEFEQVLTQKDLTDIWQNLPPSIGRKFEAKSVTMQHELLENEFFGGELGDKIRWLVFKVKQRAANNYFKMLADSVKDERFEFEFTSIREQSKKEYSPDYSANWPYDHFSLVELIKLDAEVIISGADGEEGES